MTGIGEMTALSKLFCPLLKNTLTLQPGGLQSIASVRYAVGTAVQYAHLDAYCCIVHSTYVWIVLDSLCTSQNRCVLPTLYYGIAVACNTIQGGRKQAICLLGQWSGRLTK